MKFIIWNGEPMTTINAIAEFYSDSNANIIKEIKPFIRTGVKKIYSLKVEKEQIENNTSEFYELLGGKVPYTGVILIKVSDVPSIEKYFSLVLKKFSNGTYKKSRFLTKRSLIEEVKLELKKRCIILEENEFSALLSYVARLEMGQPKLRALKDSADKFNVTQVHIIELFNSLELQIDYVNKPKDYI